MPDIKISIIDTHAHLDTFARRGEIEKIIAEAKASGVDKIVLCSDSRKNWDLYKSLVEKYPDTFAWEIGIHPTELNANFREELSEMEGYISALPAKLRPVAIGEIGLDFYLDSNLPDRLERRKSQTEAFVIQVSLAKKLKLPICVHARDAVRESIDELKRVKFDFSKVVFHCFSGTVAEIKELNLLGARGSFTGIITYKSAGIMREAMLAQGLEKLMLETDCPYLAPTPLRGSENAPKNVRITAEEAAKLFGISPEEIACITTKNAKEFFGLSD